MVVYQMKAIQAVANGLAPAAPLRAAWDMCRFPHGNKFCLRLGNQDIGVLTRLWRQSISPTPSGRDPGSVVSPPGMQ